MQLNPYLTFNGQCEAAFKFYEKCLGGKIEAMLTHEGTPAEQDVPSEWRKKILHARLTVGDQALMGSDAPPERYDKPQGFSVSLNVDKPAEAERVRRGRAGRARRRHAALPISVHGAWLEAAGCAQARLCHRPRGGCGNVSPSAGSCARCGRQILRRPHDVAGAGGIATAGSPGHRLPWVPASCRRATIERAGQTSLRRADSNAVPPRKPGPACRP